MPLIPLTKCTRELANQEKLFFFTFHSTTICSIKHLYIKVITMVEEKAIESDQPQKDAESTLQNEETSLNHKFIQSIITGDRSTVQDLLREGADLISVDQEGRTPLHFACLFGHSSIASYLIQQGHPWNLLDNVGRSVGEYAKDGGHHDLYDELVQEGCRAELILNLVDRVRGNLSEDEDDNDEAVEEPKEEANEDTTDPTSTTKKASNQDYLSQKLEYDGDKLLDAEKNGVMMGWESPLMKYHADIICPEPGRCVLNVGFGMGIIDTELQLRQPGAHHIIEAHPDVVAHMHRQGWHEKPNVFIHVGRWQDVVPKLLEQGLQFDGIFFDTFGEFYEDLREFCEHVPNLLSYNGVYSFFNGLGGRNVFFHDVYKQLIELELRQMGLQTEYTTLSVDSIHDTTWDGVKREYWSLDSYYLPKCTFLEE
jgi:protein arginine N-methyltransferase 2